MTLEQSETFRSRVEQPQTGNGLRMEDPKEFFGTLKTVQEQQFGNTNTEYMKAGNFGQTGTILDFSSQDPYKHAQAANGFSSFTTNRFEPGSKTFETKAGNASQDGGTAFNSAPPQELTTFSGDYKYQSGGNLTDRSTPPSLLRHHSLNDDGHDHGHDHDHDHGHDHGNEQSSQANKPFNEFSPSPFERAGNPFQFQPRNQVQDGDMVKDINGNPYYKSLRHRPDWSTPNKPTDNGTDAGREGTGRSPETDKQMDDLIKQIPQLIQGLQKILSDYIEILRDYLKGRGGAESPKPPSDQPAQPLPKPPIDTPPAPAPKPPVDIPNPPAPKPPSDIPTPPAPTPKPGDGPTKPGDKPTTPGDKPGTGTDGVPLATEAEIQKAMKQIDNRGASQSYIKELEQAMREMPQQYVQSFINGKTKMIAYGEGPRGLGGSYNSGTNVITMYETAPFSTKGVLACEMAHNWDLNPYIGKHVSSESWYRDAYQKARQSGISQGDNSYSNQYEFIHHMAKYYSGLTGGSVGQLMDYLGPEYKQKSRQALMA